MRDAGEVLMDLVRELHVEARLAIEEGRRLNDQGVALPLAEALEPIAQARAYIGESNGLLFAADRLKDAMEASGLWPN